MTVNAIPTHPLANLRDLGGIRVAGGAVRRGVLFRSDDVALVDEAGALALVESGLSLVIDLRSGVETERTGRGQLAGHPVTYLHLPLTDDVTGPAAELLDEFTASGDPECTMGRWYADLLRQRAARIVSGLDAVATHPGATLFHCAAGKDRTGVFAAVVLDLLGASEEDIVEDYARTDAAIEAILARFSAGHPAAGAARPWGEVPPVMMSAPRRAMGAMFGDIRAREGSVRALLREHGLDDRLERALRERLVEPA